VIEIHVTWLVAAGIIALFTISVLYNGMEQWKHLAEETMKTLDEAMVHVREQIRRVR